eukprot:TRINITY_DN8867_c0_g1_i1.p1 TRINITY_DN8867_c0_g1~~TRINITY_DN8867_c0_g1_i1.p1  ORF type:complete len:439 (+),score=68.32 TRINITY_DN8867_c0_g1_i1:2-1318(+)
MDRSARAQRREEVLDIVYGRREVEQNWADGIRMLETELVPGFDPVALYLVGLSYERGYCVEKSEAHGRSLLKQSNLAAASEKTTVPQLKALDLNDPINLFALAERYLGVDSAASARYYLDAANLGFLPAYAVLARFCCNTTRFSDDGVISEHKQLAYDFLVRAAGQGHCKAIRTLGHVYRDGTLGIAVSPSLACDWYERGVALCDGKSMVALGFQLESGTGRALDALHALSLYQVAADQYHVGQSYHNLGCCYRDGTLEVAVDVKQAFKYFELGAALGNSDAKVSLGYLLETEEGYIDYPRAFKMYLESAAEGNAQAQNNLGCVYRDGTGVAADELEATYWFKLAAAQNHGEAILSLGSFYESGLGGLPLDLDEALLRYRKAADMGIAQAQYNMGSCYEEGVGVEQDVEEALRWFKIAALSGFADGVEAMVALTMAPG